MNVSQAFFPITTLLKRLFSFFFLLIPPLHEITCNKILSGRVELGRAINPCKISKIILSPPHPPNNFGSFGCDAAPIEGAGFM